MKIVINKCYGGFSISKEAAEFMADRGNKDAIEKLKRYKDDEEEEYWYWSPPEYYMDYEGDWRTNPDLIAAVEVLGARADGPNANLKIVEIPDDVEYYIDEYDGVETIREKHRSWG